MLLFVHQKGHWPKLATLSVSKTAKLHVYFSHFFFRSFVKAYAQNVHDFSSPVSQNERKYWKGACYFCIHKSVAVNELRWQLKKKNERKKLHAMTFQTFSTDFQLGTAFQFSTHCKTDQHHDIAASATFVEMCLLMWLEWTSFSL